MCDRLFNSLSAILVISTFGVSDGLLKHFIATWDFSNENNWKDGILPCSNSEVSLNSRPENSILIDENTQILSLAMGHDSTFIVGEDKILSFADNGRSCGYRQRKVAFHNKAKGFWWDPESWSCTSNDILECNLATPHITRVPCDRDDARFPDPFKSLFKIIITRPIPTVADLRIDSASSSRHFTHTSEFSEYAMTLHGQKIIRKNSHDSNYVYIETRPDCPSTGCSCHSDSPRREVCKIMQRKCPKPQCEQPIAINGFCCDTCGSSLRISHNGSLAMDAVRKLLRQTISKTNSVDGHLASMDDGFYEAIFVPKRPGEESNYIEVSQIFRKSFNEELNDDGFHASLLISSGEAYVTTGKENSSSYLIILGIIFIITVAAGAVYIKKYRRTDLSNFDFRRFSLRGRRESTLSTVTLSSSGTGQGVRFVNPIFNVHDAIRDQAISEIPELSEMESPTQRSNPLFDVDSKNKPISLANLKQRLEPDIEEEQVENSPFEGDSRSFDNPSFEPIPPELISHLVDNKPLVEYDTPPDNNPLIECDTSSEESQGVDCDVQMDENPFAEPTVPFPSEPSDEVKLMPGTSTHSELEEKVEIEALDPSMLNIFQEEKPLEIPAQNELTDSVEDGE